jgi:16S rRNA (cytidine1402-2'-O)-methyltransferase
MKRSSGTVARDKRIGLNKTHVIQEQDSLVGSGVLYLVSTPIGNLKDISFRALEVLSGVDIIAAEDTRRTRILLQHYNIRTRTTSYHDFNKENKTPSLLKRLSAGESVAIVSDAGTPGISDPAFYFVRAAIAEQIKIEAIPGATAFIPALIVSGLPTDRFVFEGFLPTQKGRNKRLKNLAEETRTIVLYESPKKLERTLRDLQQHLGDRQIAIVRELTKKFEDIRRSLISEILEQMPTDTLRGEFVIVVGGKRRKTNK